MALRAVTSNGVAITPSSVSLPTGGTFDLYNTADQTTNYERLRADWSSNVARLSTQIGGSGTARALRVGAATDTSNAPSVYTQYGVSTPFISHVIGSTSAATGHQWGVTFSASGGTQTAFNFAPTINQSGTAGYTALDINPTESATGSGMKLLQRWAVGGSAQAYVSNIGVFAVTGLTSSGGIGFGSSLGSSDLTLNRDAADTLALRRSTNAQTFRVYNTYTDGSNYERGVILWNSNNFDVLSQSAGTGTVRDLRIYTGGASSLYLGSNSSMRFQLNTSGHLLAVADNTYDIGVSGANRPRALYLAGGITHGSATLLTTTTALTNGAAAATGTLTNAPAAGNPTKWIPINDNGTTRYIPAW